MPSDFFLASWDTLAAVAVSAVVIYALLVAMLRLSGKRTLAKFNAFDFVVTVALGSMVATTILNDETSVAAGALGIALLIGLQMAVSYGVTRWRGVQQVIKSQPRLLYYRGEFQRDSLLSERVSTEEIRLVVRHQGYAKLDDLLAVVLETDGTMSVIGKDVSAPMDALSNVQGAEGLGLDVGDRQPPSGKWEEPSRTARSTRAADEDRS